MGRVHCKMLASFHLDHVEIFPGGFGRCDQSPVERALQPLEQLPDTVVIENGRRPESARMNHKRFCRRLLGYRRS